MPLEPLGLPGNRVSREAYRSDLVRLAIRMRSTTKEDQRVEGPGEKPDQQPTPMPAIVPELAPKVRCAAAAHCPSLRLAIL